MHNFSRIQIVQKYMILSVQIVQKYMILTIQIVQRYMILAIQLVQDYSIFNRPNSTEIHDLNRVKIVQKCIILAVSK